MRRLKKYSDDAHPVEDLDGNLVDEQMAEKLLDEPLPARFGRQNDTWSDETLRAVGKEYVRRLQAIRQERGETQFLYC